MTSVAPFEVDRGLIADGGVNAMRVVPAFDEGEDRDFGFAMGAERAAIEELAFEGGEEALAQGVVVAVADGAHGRSDAGVTASLPEGDGRVLASLIRMMDDVAWLPLFEGHAEGI